MQKQVQKVDRETVIDVVSFGFSAVSEDTGIKGIKKIVLTESKVELYGKNDILLAKG